MDAAARLYFGVSARRVTLWQAAVLAGLPRAPSRFNPRADPAAAAARAREVLTAMAETGAITAEQARAAAAQIAFPPAPPLAAGWFADWVAEQAQALAPANADATLRTTLDARLQAIAEARLAAMLDGPGRRPASRRAPWWCSTPPPARCGRWSAGATIARARSTAPCWPAASRARRSSRSSGWPRWRRACGRTTPCWTRRSASATGARPISSGGILGEITVEEALAQSINTAAVRLLLQAGGPRAVARRRHDWASPTSCRTTPRSRWAPARSGCWNSPRPMPRSSMAASASRRSASRRCATAPQPAVDPDQAAMMVRMLAAVVTRGTGRAAAVPGRLVAGKTGTTQDYRDAWFIGCIDGEIIGVWLGNDDNRPMKSVHGGGLPARLFHDIAISR